MSRHPGDLSKNLVSNPGFSDVFVPLDETEWREWSYQGVMPPSDDRPLPTPKMSRIKRGKLLINGIPAAGYLRQHPEGPH